MRFATRFPRAAKERSFEFFLVQQSLDFDRQAEQIDKAFRIVLVVDVLFPERGDLFAVQGMQAESL